MIFKTQNGSVYTLDRGTMGWCRLKTARSGKIRREFGTLLTWPLVQVGACVILNDSTIQPGCDVHLVSTSRVVEVSE